MDIATFWKMIEAARKASNGDIEQQRELLVETLAKESAEDIVEFDQILHDMKDKADRASIWEVGYFLHCTGGDSVFDDFRSWLIAQGEEIFEKAIENPDTLAEILDAEHRMDAVYERFGYVGYYAYQRKTGQEIWDVRHIPGEEPQYEEPFGEIHDEEEWPQLFPALTAKLGTCDEWEAKYLDDYLNKGRRYNDGSR